MDNDVTPKKPESKKDWRWVWLKPWNQHNSWFTSDRQPTREQLQKWWDRRRNCKKILDDIFSKQDYTIENFINEFMVKKERKTKDWTVVREWYEPKETLTISEAYNVRYVYWHIMSWSLDWLNRHINYAPSKIEHSWEDWKDLFSSIKITIDGAKS